MILIMYLGKPPRQVDETISEIPQEIGGNISHIEKFAYSESQN